MQHPLVWAQSRLSRRGLPTAALGRLRLSRSSVVLFYENLLSKIRSPNDDRVTK